MRIRPTFVTLACVLLSTLADATAASADFYGIGNLPGTVAPMSQVRDATNTDGGIVAVGAARQRGTSGAEDTAVRWTPAGGLVALPDIVTNTTGFSFITASALTADGSLVLGRSRSAATGNRRVATTWSNGGTTATSLGFLASGVNLSAANGASADGAIIYGFGANGVIVGTPPNDVVKIEAFRYSSGAMVGLGFLNTGDVSNIPAARAVSADGAVMAGTSGSTGSTGPGNRAYRYVHGGSGMTALPLPSGGTWSCALALTPDGNFTFGVGNSTAAPNGEAILWDASAGSTTRLGTPNPSWAPSNFGGITSNGAVVATSFGPANSDESTAFIHNAQGWFSLHHVLAAAGANLSGWNLDTILGLSPDGTLVFGQGWHNGTREGWIARVDAGVLAAVSTAAKVEFVYLGKLHEFKQTGPTTVADVSATPWQLHARIEGKGFTTNDPNPPNQITPPSGSGQGVTALAFVGPDEWAYATNNDPAHGYGSQATLDTAYGNGTYAFKAGAATANIPVNGNLYPDAPVANLSAGTWSGGVLQLDVSQPLTITVSFGTTNYLAGRSFLGIEVHDSNFGADNGNDLTTSTVTLRLPAFALAPNRTYHVSLDAIRASSFDTTTIAGATIVGGYESVTGFDIATGPAAVGFTIAGWGPDNYGQLVQPRGQAPFKAISTLANVTLAVRMDGTVVGWGSGSQGRLNIPAGLGNVVSVGVGTDYCVALQDNGSVVAWGDGASNVPALNDVAAISVAFEGVALKRDGSVVSWRTDPTPAGLIAIAVAAGKGGVALKPDGTVAQWGEGNFLFPVPSGLNNVVAIAAASDHRLALKSDGTVVTWGRNDHGQRDVPAGLNNVIAVAASGLHSVALKSDGTVVTWGGDGSSQITPPADLTEVVAIAAGDNQTVVLHRGVFPRVAQMAKTAGGITLGVSTLSSWSVSNSVPWITVVPTSGTGPALVTVTAAAQASGGVLPRLGSFTVAGRSISVYQAGASARGGTLALWGDQFAPPGGLGAVIAVAAGNNYYLAVKADGTVAAWGNSNDLSGKLSVPSGLNNVTAVATAYDYSFALKGNGTLAAWGSGASAVPTGTLSNVIAISGEEGNKGLALKADGSLAEFKPGATPVPPVGVPFIAASEGGGNSIGLKPSGTVFEWGGDSANVNVPAGLADVVAVAAGFSHRLALKADGTVVAWGGNGNGQTNVPSGLNNVVAIAAGNAHSLALKSDGTVVGWGSNAGTNVPAGLTSVAAISAASNRSVALVDNPVPAPTIASFSPTTIASGLTVIITGTGFSGATNVQFGGSNASSFTVDSPTQITATVPFGLPTSAAITVITAGGTGASSSNYTLTFAPVISNFTPTSGPTGRVVVINGANFNNGGQPTVRFNGTATTYGVNTTSNQLIVFVPAGATTGTISVQTFQGTATSSTSFTVEGGTAPSNDNFASAAEIANGTGSVSGTTANATRETGEPRHAGETGGSSVWYRFTAPNTGRFVFDPTGSEIRPAIGVYTGSSLGNLAPVAVSRSPFLFGGYYSGGVVLEATASSVYHIAIDGVSGMSGGYQLAWMPLAAPTIASFTPTSGYAGQSVTITGTNFAPISRVTIGGVAPSLIRSFISSSTSITIHQLPVGAATGPIVVTTPTGSVSSSDFTVTATPVPTILNITPSSGGPGTPVTINGTALALGNALQDVRFNGVPAFASGTGSSATLFTNVPPNATTGAVTVVTSAGTGTSSTNFTVTGPTIANLTPANGRWGTSITLTGTGLTGASSVFFAPGVSATPTVNSDTSITVTVPVGAGTGPVSVSTPAGGGSSATPFTLDAPFFTAKNPSPNSAQLGAIAFGNGVYVAAGTAGVNGSPGEIWRSTDSVNWSSVFHAAGGIQALAFANGVFVAVGNNGTILSSTDGSTWANATWPGDPQFYGGVTFANGNFVAIGGNRVRTSVNGTTWTAPRLFANFSGGMNGLAFGAGLFVAAGDSGFIFTSPDGNDWTLRGSGTQNRLRHVAFINGQFVVGGDNGTLLTSPDGLAWTPRTLPNAFTGTVFASTFGAGKYVAVSFSTIFTSTDAITWTSTYIAGDLRALLFANSQFVGAGSPGCVMTSPDAATWTLRSGFTFESFNDATYGNGRYVAVGANGIGAMSLDGQSWTTTRPIVPNRNIPGRRVVYAKAKFVVVGDNDLWGSSLDGVNWTGNPAITNGRNLNALAFGNGNFVAAGSGGVVRTSSDGTTWTLAEPATGLSSGVTINGLEFANNLFVAVGSGGAIYTSADRVTWTAQTSGTGANLNSVTFAAGLFVAVGDNSTVLTSGNGTTWTSRTLGAFGVLLADVAFGDGWFVAVPRSFQNSGEVFISLDGITWARRTVGLSRFNNGGSAGVAFGNGRFLGVSGGGQLSLSDPLPGALLIATQPPATTPITPGTSATLSVTASGPGPTYQWYQGASGDTSSPASGASATTATFTTPVLNQSAQFWVRVSTGSGAFVDSATARITSPADGPVISGQPAPLTTIQVGQGASLSVTATGSGTLTYEWRRNGLAIPGATGTSFAISNASQSDSDLYDVVVSDGFNTTASAAARIVVTPTANPGNIKLDANFDLALENEINGAVLATAAHNGGLLIGGDFVRVNGVVRRRLARFNGDGSLDTNFAPTFNFTVSAIVVQPGDNKIVVAGQFTNVNGAARNFLARLNADGTTDPSFNPGGSGPSGNVASLFRQPADGKFYIAGGFNSYNGANMNRLARLNADGTLDTGFDPGSGVTSGPGVIPSLALDTSFTPARLLIGGSFTTYNGEPVNRVARVLSTGARDSAFNIGTGAEGVVNATVNAIAYDAANNAVLIGGSFTTFNGTPINRLARLTSAGALDPTFVVGTGTSGASGPNGTVSAIALDTSVSPARVVIAGSFSNYNNAATPINRVARLDHAGALDSAFNPNPSSNVNALRVESNSVVLGGSFGMVGATNALRLARISMTGSLLAAPVTSMRAAGNVFRLLPLPGGKLLVGGAFTHVGETARTALVRLDSNLTLDTTFNVGGAGPNFLVNSAVLQGDGKIVIGGNFNTYNGATANRVARLNPDGTLDASFNVGSGPSTNPNTLFALPGGRTLVGGSFSTFAGANQASLVRLNLDGSLDTSFNAGTGTFSVNAIGVQSTGKIVVGGSFSFITGQARNNIARFNTDGALDTSFDPGTGAGSSIRALAVQADDRIFIGGDFSTYNGTAANRIARLNAGGSLDTSFAPGGPLNNSVSAFVRQEDGRVIVFGQFTNTGSAANASFLTRLSAAGPADSSFASFGLNFHASGISAISALHVLDDGRVLLGTGTFTSNFLPASQQEKYGLALLIPGVARQITQQPANVAVNAGQPATFSVTATGDAPLTYQWRKFRVPIAGATNASYTIAATTSADNGGYDVQVTNVAGTIVSNSAMLTVNFAPVLALQPQSVAAAPNTTAAFAVAVSAEPPAGFQWFKGTTAIPGANGSTLMIPNVQPADAGTYSVVVTNSLGTVTSAGATLTLTDQPVITAAPASAYVIAGGNATLSVTATGTGTLTYQWRKNGVAIAGATSSSLTLGNVDASQFGLYDVTVTNASGTTTSQRATVSLDSPFLDESFAPPQFGGVNLASRLELLSDGSFILGNLANSPSLLTRRAAPFQHYAANGARDLAFDFTLPIDFGFLTAAAPIAGGFYASVSAGRYLLDGDRMMLVRFNNDGTVDAAFPPFAYDRPSRGNGEMRGLAVDNNGKVVAAGFFPNLAGSGRAGVARFNSDGTLDSGFAVTTMAGGNGVWSRPVFDANNNILVGGDFNTFNGLGGLQGIVRLLPTGANDPAFLATGFQRNAPVRGIVVQSDGRIVLGGRFTVNGVPNIPFVRLHPNGLIDTTFVLTPVAPLANGAAMTIRDMIPLPNDKFAGVSFSVYVRNADGSPVAAGEFTPPALLDAIGGSFPEAFGIRRYADGSYVVAGLFTHVNGQLQPNVARMAADGTLQPFPVEPMAAVNFPLTFLRTASGRTLGAATASANLSSNGLADLLPDGRPADVPFSATLSSANQIIAVAPGGNDRVVAVVVEPNESRTLRRVLADGSADPGFMITTTFTGTQPDTPVVQPDGRILLTSRTALSNQDIVNGERLRRVNADGTPDASYNPALDGSAAPVRGTPLPGEPVGPLQSVTRLAIEIMGVDAGNRAYVRYSATGNAVRLARLNPDGSRDTSFAIVTTPMAGVTAPFVASVNDPLRPAAGVVQIQLAAGVRREFEDVIVQSGGKLVVGGEFSSLTINGTTVAAPGIVRLNADGTLDPTFNSGGTGLGWVATPTTATEYPAVEGLVQQSDGRLLVAGNFEAYNGSPAPGLMRLNPDGTRDSTYVAPVSRIVRYLPWCEMELQSDGSVLLSGPFAVPGEIYPRGLVRLLTAIPPAVMIADLAPASAGTGATVTINGVGFDGATAVKFNGIDAASFTVVSGTQITAVVPTFATTGTVSITAPGGTATSPSALTVVAGPRLMTASTRATVGTGENALLGNFTIEGSAAKMILVRAVGPTLSSFGVAGQLADPVLTVHDATGAIVAANDDWGGSTTLSSAFNAAGAFALAANSKDSALLVSLNPGTYTARVAGAGGTTGVALLEVYDTNDANRLVYLSSRAHAAASTPVATGFVIGGGPTSSKTVLIRAVGTPLVPALGALINPTMSVFAGSTLVAGNDDWGSGTNLAALNAATAAVGAMPLASADSALLLTLAPGAYTVQVSGVGGTTGFALTEVFLVDGYRAGSFRPALIAPLQNRSVDPGASVYFNAPTVGKPGPVTYQWKKNGVNVTGASGVGPSTLFILSAAAGDAGSYTVTMTNSAGATPSAAATLSLNPPAGFSATHSVVGGGYFAGSTATITSTLTYAGTGSSLGWSVNIPAGWSFASDGGSAGDIKPSVGTTQTLEWAWTTIPASPVTFTYTLNVPPGETGVRTLTASGIVRTTTTSGALSLTAAPDPLTLDQITTHTGDTDRNFRISLLELTRVIELYNTRNGTTRTGCYRVQDGSEDGFAQEPARASSTVVTLAKYHAADSNRDGKLSLLELTRVIELYNYRSGTTRTGQYHVQAGTEDGYATGP